MAEAVHPPRVTVAQIGSRNHYALPQILHEAGMLERLFTDSYVGNKPWLEAGLRAIPRVVRPRALERWLGRRATGVPPERVTSFDGMGLGFELARRLRSVPDSVFFAQVSEAFAARILSRGFGNAQAVWGYTGTNPVLFRSAKDRGLRCFYEQFDHTRKTARLLAEEEIRRWPDWQPALEQELRAGNDRQLKEFEAECVDLADRVIVPSRYTQRSLAESDNRINHTVVVPYGVAERPAAQPRRPDRRLQILFVGAVDLRKGVPYLLEALRVLDARTIDAQIVGHIHLNPAKLSPYGHLATMSGPIPRIRMAEVFGAADLLVFPTLGEGFGMVQLEAMAAGVPTIITTPCCGDVVREGTDGHLIAPRDISALASLLDRYAARPADLTPMRLAARERAEHFSMTIYRQRLVAALVDSDASA